MMSPMDSEPSAAPPRPDSGGGAPPGGRRTLYREPDDKKIAGVCGGLADYTGVDPALVRAGAVFLAVVQPLTIVAYLVAIFVVRNRPPSVPRVKAPPVEVLERHTWVPIALIVAAVVIGLDGPWWWWPDVPLAAPLLIGIGVWLFARSRSDGQPPAASAGPGAAPGAAPGPFGPSTDQPQNVADTPTQTPWSSHHGDNYLSLGVDTTTRNEDAGPTVDRTADLRDAAGDVDAGAGGFASTETDLDPDPRSAYPVGPGQTGSPPADEGAGPPGGLPPLTPPEWSGPEPSGRATQPGGPGSWDPSSAPDPFGSWDPYGTLDSAGPGSWDPSRSSGSPAASSGPGTAVTYRKRGSERLGLLVASILLIGGGAAWFVDTTDIAEVDPRDVLAVGLVVAGAGLVVAAWRGRARVMLIPLGLLVAAALASAEVVDVPLDAGMGDRTVRVDRSTDLDEPIELLAGELVVDLRDAPLSAARPTTVRANLGVGELRVLVPRSATLVVDADIRAGQVAGALNRSADADGGVLIDERYVLRGADGAPRVNLVLDVGIGQAEVVRD
jgi:phage shock protein PspC (stress-responsive transcriptional regulator)